MTTPTHDRARSFGHAASDYRRARPTYPPGAVRWLVPDGAQRVLDLAAGTGKLTGQLVELGLDVVAVEPDDAMRAELRAAVPGARTLAGTAESIPLDDRSFDAVVVAQAWHWFAERAISEVVRVLAPAGGLGIVWNVLDRRTPWVDAFNRLIEREPGERAHRDPELGDGFGPVEHATFDFSHRIPAPALRTLAASHSHALTLAPAERGRLLDEVDELARTAGAEIDLPYRAECWRARRR